MPGVGWLVFSWGAIAIFVAVMTCRVVSIARLPIHLRWELAPIPHEKGKGDYGGSYLEEYEWWRKKRSKSIFAPLVYMAGEILLLKGGWRHNRSLWPFSFSLHAGLYLFILMLVVQVASFALSLAGFGAVCRTCLEVASLLCICSCFLGIVGAVGLIVKRIFDRNLRWSNNVGTFFNLVFLGAVFVSGVFAWFLSVDPGKDMNFVIRGLITFDSSLSIAGPLAVHTTFFLLCAIYLPFTSMVHLAGKYFMYHGVRWNDEPLNGRMERELTNLISQPVAWGGKHVGKNGRRSWAELGVEESSDDET
jgi:nitrate reductase gamma subunit